jgi:SAM-dependent methyltransferase
MRPERSIKSFWDKAAAENPYWYVSAYCPYSADRNLDEFWASGHTIWTDIKQAVGYTPSPTDTVVEIGCGVGRLTRAIAPEVGSVIALDISEEMLAMARKADLSNAKFCTAAGFSLPGIPDRSADFVLAYCVFQHLPSHAALKSYLVEMCRVAKPGSLMAFTLTARDWNTWLLPILRTRAYLREHLLRAGPKGVYRKEWVGITPSSSVVSGISPIRLEVTTLGARRILYFGRCEMATIAGGHRR